MVRKNKALWGLVVLAVAGIGAFFLLRKKKLDCSLEINNKIGQQLTVDVSVSGGTSPYEVLIFWGDGEVSQETEGGQYTHTYPNPGNAEILLQVTDTEESKCDKSLEVQI